MKQTTAKKKQMRNYTFQRFTSSIIGGIIYKTNTR